MMRRSATVATHQLQSSFWMTIATRAISLTIEHTNFFIPLTFRRYSIMTLKNNLTEETCVARRIRISLLTKIH